MTINEIAEDILKKEDNQLARAFTMAIGSLLLSKGIEPIINKSIEEWNANDDLNKYVIRKEYNVTFDVDTTKHDAQIRAEEREKTIDDFIKFIFARNVIHNQKFITREEEYFLNMAEEFLKKQKSDRGECMPS